MPQVIMFKKESFLIFPVSVFFYLKEQQYNFLTFSVSYQEWDFHSHHQITRWHWHLAVSYVVLRFFFLKPGLTKNNNAGTSSKESAFFMYYILSSHHKRWEKVLLSSFEDISAVETLWHAHGPLRLLAQSRCPSPKWVHFSGGHLVGRPVTT